MPLYNKEKQVVNFLYFHSIQYGHDMHQKGHKFTAVWPIGHAQHNEALLKNKKITYLINNCCLL